MIVAPDFVYLHAPKTGGMWVRKAMGFSGWPVRSMVGDYQHTDLGHVPSALLGKPIITTVRNPYEWWISWFFYNKRLNEARWARRYQKYPANIAGFRQALPKLVENGSIQWRYVQTHNYTADHVVRFERLREGLIEAMEACNADVSVAFRRYILESPRVNSTKHPSPADAYRDEDRKLVEGADSNVFRRFGYAFPSA